jgi:putative ABC transport system permease protein
MYSLAQNLRLAFRQLSKSPGFTLTVIVTLALGIGATTAIFSLVEGVLLRPLPFKDADRLVLLGDHLGNARSIGVTAREIGTYSKAAGAFSSMGAFAGESYELSGGATPEEIEGERLTASVFPTLGVSPMVGRTFTEQEEDAHTPVVVIAYPLWLNRYHRDPQVVGKSIVLDRRAYTIVGVMPRGFEFPLQPGLLDHSQLWAPLSLTAEDLSEASAGFWGYHIIARLKDGVTTAQAAQDADRVAKEVMRNFPASMASLRIRGDVKPLLEEVVAGVRPLLRTLFLAVIVVLSIACVNVAGLLLVRAIRRRREYAVRLALGARSSAILRESVYEGMLLSVAGGVAGLALAAAALRVALRLLPDTMPRVDSVSIDGRVVGFGLLLSLVTGILCSLAPAFAALRTNLTDALKEGSRTGTGASSHSRLRSALVVAEIAIALVLLTVSGAFLKSFQKMRAVDPGFRADHLLVAGYKLPLKQYPTQTSMEIFNHAVVDRLAGKPGVMGVGLTTFLPASGLWGGSGYTIEGVSLADWKLKFAMFSSVYGDYFRTMGITLLEGRYFTPQDKGDSPLVVIVNQTMARESWPGQSAIGKRMHAGNPHKGYPWATVVGVVADTKLGPRDEPTAEQWYIPAEQPTILSGPDFTGKLTSSAGGYVALRSGLPPEELTATLRSAIAEVDPLLPVQQVESMEDVISNVEAPPRFNTGLITAFAGGALLLSITGIYAVVAFSVSLRSQEIAIRMALGAQRSGIARLVLISGAKLALFGCALGVLGSVAASRLVSSFLFDVSATDPRGLAGSALTMMLMALLASALPASRAASADPIDALRSS